MNANYCRICLKNNGFFDWTEEIFEFYGPTYQECYYKYNQLQKQDDEFSQMICLDCGNDLRNTYQLVEKALLATDKIANEGQCQICLNNDVFFDWNEVIFEFFGPTYKECYYQYTNIQEQGASTIQMLCLDCGNGLRNTHQLVEKSLKSYKNLKEGTYEIERVVSKQFQDVPIEELSEQHAKEESNDLQEKLNKRKRKSYKGRPIMCSYCSKISHSLHHFLKHEKTHTRKERTHACPVCGLKFYEADDVKRHLTVHDENRKPNYKCELCPKAFYTPSGLRYHRLKHLGVLVKCHICSKTYCREIDLSRHIRVAHDLRPIAKDNLDPKTKIKEYKECKTCGQKIRTSSWRNHISKHLNEPQVQCNICNKTYFVRKSIIRHITKAHNITNNDYSKYIITLERKYKPRHTSLMKKQHIEID